NNTFSARNQLLKVPKLGPKAFEQCAGFLRIKNGKNSLDNSAIHPESYWIVEKMADDLGILVKDLQGNQNLISKIELKKYVTEEIGLPTLEDIIRELQKPGLDPREEFTYAKFDASISSITDLQEGMILEGSVTNVTNFGAFVDIGVHQDGLIHISKLADRFIKNPAEVIAVGERVSVKVIGIDLALKRIQLQRV
ncbi:MAG: S1 RNA-binding domain-containing protein, partial [Candidatus Margulisiibacteriota bacterium]